MTDLKRIVGDIDTMIRSADSHMAEGKAQDVKDRYHTYALGLASVKGMIEGFVQELQKELTEMEYWRKAYPYLDVPKKDAEIKLLRHVIGEEHPMADSVGNTPPEAKK